MKRSISLVLAILMVASLMTFGSMGVSAEMTTLVAAGSDGWTWTVTGDGEAVWPEGWQLGENISAWTANGDAPFGNVWFAHDTEMDGAKAAAVKEFTVSDVSSFESLVLNIRYDEDPKVYINGTLVFEAAQWHDAAFKTVDITDKLSTVKDGTNIIAIEIAQSSGGFGFDLSLEAGTVDPIDADGNVILKSATGKGANGADENGKGGIGAYDNILDGDNNSMYGSWYEEGMYVEVSFWDEVAVTEIKFEGKNEGTPNADGISGLVDVYVGETLVADDAYVIRKDLGGYTITFDAAVVGSSVKFAFESAEKWYAGGFVGIADVYVKGVPVEQAAVEGVIEYAGTQGSSDSNAVRFVSSTESLDFDKIGMMISTVEATGAPRSWNASSSKVYTTIKSADGDHVAPEGEYYMGAELSGIPEGDYTFTIVPYAKTAGGMVIGEIVSVTVNVTPNGVTVAN